MKRMLLLVLPILVIVTIAFTLFGTIQVRFEEERLIDDLKRKAWAVNESLEFSVRPILMNSDLEGANRLVESFQRRERLQGCAIYDRDGKILAITDRIAAWGQEDRPYIKEVLAKQAPWGGLENFKEYSVYSYVLPVRDRENNFLGMVEVVYDTSNVFSTLTALWRRLSITLIALLVVIVLILLLIQKRIFTLPVIRLTEWFQHFQRGETDAWHSLKATDELGRLASEVEQVALSLRIARRVVSEQASERLGNEELWTEDRLRDTLQARLGENALFLVSNREPYMHIIDEATAKPKCVRPVGGVVTALDPIMRACGGMWIAHGSGNADRQFVNSQDKLGVPPEDINYILKRVWLSKEEEQGYYYGFANEGLWPLCHITHTRPSFRESDWLSYQQVNQKFADSVVQELPARNPFIFIQDYHFTLLARMIKEKRPDASIALFWHIPWPNPEVFSTCPYHAQILDGMLACDLVGFHVQMHCNNFLDTANRLLESRVDSETFSVVRLGKETAIRSFPISVDESMARELSEEEHGRIAKIRQEYHLEGQVIAVGVDRIDYTKGLIERLLAVDRFLEKYPQFKRKFVFIQLAAPSRTHIQRYHDFAAEVDGLVEKINWKHSEENWRPILYFKRHFSQEEIRPFYALADVCIVSSLHDGMNLVAKEYVTAKTDLQGILILSRFTGAAKELTQALLINPYSTEEFADNIKLAAAMSAEEKCSRMRDMRNNIKTNNVYRWAGNIITEWTSLKKRV
jgi:alpha,alpha-trehalose-phosphate synthase [UDP-forming]